jgi:hypothetical protein
MTALSESRGPLQYQYSLMKSYFCGTDYVREKCKFLKQYSPEDPTDQIVIWVKEWDRKRDAEAWAEIYPLLEGTTAVSSSAAVANTATNSTVNNTVANSSQKK